MKKQKAIIIGAGPAGLTAAYELLMRTDIIPIVLEKSDDIGGISKTVNYKGNRIDIGGHRFFSKSDRVMKWWLHFMPLQKGQQSDLVINYQNASRSLHTEPVPATTPDDPEKVMLVRQRLSRIYFLRKFFQYPIRLSLDTLKKLGITRFILIIASYLKARIFPRKHVTTLEDFLVNNFGYQLYSMFFQDYTEKVWGVPCKMISAEWGAQRIKGVSITKALRHAVTTSFSKKNNTQDIGQKGVETSLIERFLYPKYGPGQLWEEVARQIVEKGGTILKDHAVKKINEVNGRIVSIEATCGKHNTPALFEGDYFFSTMPVQELVHGMNGTVPHEVKEIAAGLQYRDFITVGILLQQLSVKQLKDTWIYIQEKDVLVGRIQIFNNWSPSMVKDAGNTWIGLEYFCNKDEAFWNKSDAELKEIGISELEQMNLASRVHVLDTTVIRMEKTYPAYFGTYEKFDQVVDYVNHFDNLFLIGRNGMHRYNNSDHSMLTAMVAVDNICSGRIDKSNIWGINTEQEYHEEKG